MANKPIECRKDYKQAIQPNALPELIDNKISIVWKDKLLRKIFLDILSNSQFRLCKYLKKDFCKKISTLVHKKSTDAEVYDEMYNWVHSQLKKKTRDIILRDNNKYRSINRAEKIRELVRKNLNTDTDPTKTTDLNILDIGCAEGAITVMVGKYMNLDPEQVHGCDVENLNTDNPYKNQFTFTHLTEQDNYKLPYNTDSYDVVLALMSLHHIPNKKIMIQEIYRILKPGGLLIIREHDCISKGFSHVLDIIHGFYSMVWANPREMKDFNDYYAKYTSSYVLKNIIQSFGFKQRYNNRLQGFPKFHKGKIINPLNYYYAVYEKHKPSNT